MRSGRQRGHVVESFEKILLNYSGMSAKAWVNLGCVTAKLITPPAEMGKQDVALAKFQETGEFCEMHTSSQLREILNNNFEYLFF